MRSCPRQPQVRPALDLSGTRSAPGNLGGKAFDLVQRACAAALLAILLVLGNTVAQAADAGNCLMCHKYPGLSRVTEDGTLRLCYVNEDTFNSSVHSKVKCQGCHTDIDKIPHDPAKKVSETGSYARPW